MSASTPQVVTRDGAPMLRAGNGRFYSLPGAPVGAAALQSLLDVGAPEPADPWVGALRAEIERRRVEARGFVPGRRRVHVASSAGETETVRRLRQRLATVVEPFGATVAPAAEAADLVLVWDVPATEGDAVAPHARHGFDPVGDDGCAVFCVYADGPLLLVDPLRTEPTDPSARCVDRRRLAASPVPEQLLDCLVSPGGTRVTYGESDDLAFLLLWARVVQVLLDWGRDAPAVHEHRRTWWRLEADSLRVSTHTVLAYPEPAPRP